MEECIKKPDLIGVNISASAPNTAERIAHPNALASTGFGSIAQGRVRPDGTSVQLFLRMVRPVERRSLVSLRATKAGAEWYVAIGLLVLSGQVVWRS